MYTTIVEKANTLGTSYCDLRVQDSSETNIEIRNKELIKSVSGKETGFGIRVIVKGTWGFYSSNNVSKSSLNNGLKKAIALANSSSKLKTENVGLAEVENIKDSVIWSVKKNPLDYSLEEKKSLMNCITKALCDFPEVKNTNIGYVDDVTRSIFINSEGSNVVNVVTRTFLQGSIVVRSNDNITSIRTRMGGTCGYELFDKLDPAVQSIESAKKAIRMLTAKPAPSGRLSVVADPELAGVFAHEAVGHACEADLVVSGESILQNRIGEQIGNKGVTIVDDPTIKNGFGSFPHDDEGVKARKKILIKNGVLREFIQDRYTADKLGMKTNGGARAESFAHRPLVRMSNTMIENGNLSFDELIEDIKYGVYAKGTRGGQVDVVKGNFQFSAQEAFLIENGRITEPLKDFSLSGSTITTLKNIDAIGNDAVLGDPGFCGKGQLVPVGDGGPHIRIQNVIVGGKS